MPPYGDVFATIEGGIRAVDRLETLGRQILGRLAMIAAYVERTMGKDKPAGADRVRR